jgi:hydroxypyruvate isomerase
VAFLRRNSRYNLSMTRRNATKTVAAAPAALSAASQVKSVPRKGRLKQSVCRWCYKDIPLEDLARECKRLGLVGIDLLTPEEWPVARKYGLIPTMGSGACTIPDGINRVENHNAIEARLRDLMGKAKAARVENLIIFSGNRKGMPDEQAWENSVRFLKKVTPQAEDLGINIVMELLNSKVNHPDYQCDRTPWGVELCKRAGSPRFKLLYDIYHMQIMEGDVIATIKANIQYFAHFHTGGVPGRHEIDATQELNYKPIVEAILGTGFQGYFAHEFIPVRSPIQSLDEATTLCDV